MVRSIIIYNVKNIKTSARVEVPAMGTKMATEDKFVTQQIIDYHVARALGGNGLNYRDYIH
ncbi:hypothetical protein [Clostridium sp. CF012]|uniref:hypothetical protein n=1 Tax=Clostridium sp. CF012 TaxID=2843319 RepID=UPI001C0AC976|nr:hypothetical protein [Clostridium sp. CF012]MBU3145824.1 hypothetical protein [Clostridium sp. CF012]